MINKGIVLSLMTLCRSSLLKDVKETFLLYITVKGDRHQN